MMMRPMAFGFDGVHNFDGSRISEVGQRQAPQLNPDAYQQNRIGNYNLQRRNLDVDLIPENQRVEPQPAQEISSIPKQSVQDSQQPIAQQQPYFQSPFSFGLGSLGYGGFSPYGGGFNPFAMMGGYGGMMGGFSPFGGYGGGYGGMMGGFSPFGGYGGFSPFGGGIYNLPQAQQAPQQQQAAQPVQQQANPFGNSIKQQYAQPAGGLFQ